MSITSQGKATLKIRNTMVSWKRSPGLKPEFLIDSFQSTFRHLLSTMSRHHGFFPVVGVPPSVVTLSMLKQKASRFP